MVIIYFLDVKRLNKSLNKHLIFKQYCYEFVLILNKGECLDKRISFNLKLIIKRLYKLQL